MACCKIISVYLWRDEANDKLPVPDTMQSFNISLTIHSPVILLAEPSPVPGSGDRETFCLHAEKLPAWARDVARAGGSHRGGSALGVSRAQHVLRLPVLPTEPGSTR